MTNHTERRDAIQFLANPYVVLVDILIATFFVVVLFVHTVRLNNAAAADPRVARIREFEQALKDDIVRAWLPARLEDESEAENRSWWRRLPRDTTAVIKRDASLIKIIMLSPTEERALFYRGSTRLTPRGERQVQRLVTILGESEAADALARERAILSITVEGHTARGEFADTADSWQASVSRAIAVQQALYQRGQRYDLHRGRTGVQRLFSPERFSVVGRGHYLGLPERDSRDPMNRRVQVEIRFTSRFREPAGGPGASSAAGE